MPMPTSSYLHALDSELADFNHDASVPLSKSTFAIGDVCLLSSTQFARYIKTLAVGCLLCLLSPSCSAFAFC